MTNLNNNHTVDLDRDRHDLLFGVRRSIRYHLRRERFFDRQHKIYTSLSALSGSATIITLLSTAGDFWPALFAASVAVFSVIDLVFGIPQAAKVHHDFAGKFFNLEKAIIGTKDICDDKLTEFKTMRLDIEIEEPPPLHILNTMCHNELLRAMGYKDKSKYVTINWIQRLLSQFMDFQEYKINSTSHT